MRNFVDGLRALWYWLPVIWYWRDFDYGSSLVVLEHSLSALYKFLSSDRAWCVHKDKDIQNLKVLLLLFKRRRTGYTDLARKIEPEPIDVDRYLWIDFNGDDCRYLEDQDWRMIWEYLSRYMRRWWD